MSASSQTWKQSLAVSTTSQPRASSSVIIGPKNGTCGEFSRSIHTFRLGRGFFSARVPPATSRSGVFRSASVFLANWVGDIDLTCDGNHTRNAFHRLLGDASLHFFSQFRKHGKRKNLGGDPLCNREITFLITEYRIGLLQVQRNRIVDAGADP